VARRKVEDLRDGLILVLAAAFTLLSCGGDDKEPADPARAKAQRSDPRAAALVRQVSAPNAKARSGVIDASVEITLRGVRRFAEPFMASASGPFRHRRGSALPDYELDMGVRDHGVELSSVGGRSYVSIGTMTLTVPKADRRKVGGITGGKVVGLLNVTEVGRPQTISAPESTGSFADFELALDALGDSQEGR